MELALQRRRLGLACLAVACLACGGAVPPTNYYVLDLPAAAPAPAPLEHTAILMPVRVGGVIRQGRIVYRESPVEVGYYEYHRWGEDPQESISRALREQVLALGTFARLDRFDGRTAADYVLRGELLRLEEVDHGGGVRAAVEISLELVESATARVVWVGTVEKSEQVSASEVRSVVAGLSAAAEQAIRQLSGELDRHLRPPG
ncbi:MAG: hypothetical protein F4Y47_15400 [Acidobacteriia bacterium]|nr:hypothetical protein [Terriglobia bacterium]MYG03143.1 hypothetical protein [Terriglobia bacterium]MYK11894.1 hypothetical protein [Terriglobia bacterium]